jgi:hypothetical protein
MDFESEFVEISVSNLPKECFFESDSIDVSVLEY